jgi:hypothetical protein
MVSRQARRPLSAAFFRLALAVVAAAALGVAAVPASSALAAPAALAVPAVPAVPAAPAVPAGLPSGCSQSGATVTCTYTSQGEHQFAVPSEVTSVTATVVGGQGGADFGTGDSGGLGAVASGTLAVTPGQVLFAEVGILGGAAGEPTKGFSDSGAGGGESDVRTCPSTGGQPCPAGSTLASRLLVAGGGGGRGAFGGAGGNAGTSGAGGNGSAGVGGRENGAGGDGATPTAAGSGGAGCDGGGDGSPGAAAGGAGGNAGPANGIDGVSGGGGGAGWFGGGAGGGCSQANDSAGSGGGGSSHAAASVTGVSFSRASAGQAPSVTIVYNILTITTTSVPAGTVGTAYSTTLAAAGTAPLSWSVAQGSSLPDGLSLSSGGTISGTPQAAGDFDFTVQVTDSSSPIQTATQALSIDVAQANPGLSLSIAPPSGATVGDSVTMTATVAASGAAPPPTGTVSFTVNGVTPTGCGSVTLTGLMANCTVGVLPAGTYTMEASYGGDGNYVASAQTIPSYVVGQATPTVSLSASPSSGATIASPVSLTATVAGASGAPAATGAVEFTLDGVAVPGCGDVSLTSGLATCAVGNLPAGSHTLEAAYSGDSNYMVSTDTITGYDVPQATPGVSLSATPASGASVTSAVGLSATVVPIAGGPAPTGSVTFLVNGAAPAGCTNVSLSGPTVSCAVGPLPAGGYTLEATYSGDNNYVQASDDITGYTVSKLTPSIQVTQSVPAPVWGQAVSFTATVTVNAAPVTSGTVQWSVGGTTVGGPVSVAPDGTASLGPLTDLAVGSDQVTAAYSGTDQVATGSGADNVVVGQAKTMTTIAVTSRRLTATVSAVAPGAGQPSGVVTFAVNGTTVGTSKLSGQGIAVLSFRSSGAETASASYDGSDEFMGSSASTATTDPVITAKVTSAHPRTKYGWYRSPVTITFTCAAGSAPLTKPCPGPVTLTHSGAAQSVTRTITDTDGGIATVSVSPVNIDLIAPVLRVTGIKNGATYEAPGPSSLACVASDSPSGLAGHCALTVTRGPAHITWKATATDKAGNVTTITGKASLTDYYVAGAPRVHGFYQVKIGGSYLVKAYVVTSKAPTYVFAAPRGQQPHPLGPSMTRIGKDLWAIQINITSKMRHYQYWTLGVNVGTHLHTIAIQLRS